MSDVRPRGHAPLNRRVLLSGVLRSAGALPLAAALGPLLIACAGGDNDTPASTTPVASLPPTPTLTPAPTATVAAATPTPLASPTASPPPAANLPEIALYRADAQRSGRFDVAAQPAQPALLWERAIGASAPPLIAGDILLVGSGGGRLLMLDADSGEERQAIAIGAPVIAAPAVADGRIFVGTDDGGLFALDAGSGSELWHAPADGIIWGAPLVVGDTVYFGADAGFLALDAATGEERFTLPTNSGRVYSPAATLDGTVYAAFGTRLVAFDATSGVVLWEHVAELDWNRLAADAAAVHCGAEDGYFYALDRLTGDELWRSALAGAFWTAPALTEQAVITGNIDGRIRALDRATGSQSWEFTADDWATADPIVAGGVVYAGVGNHEGRAGERPLYALDLATGDLLWSFKTDGLIHAGVAVDSERIYVVTTNGTLYALG